MKKLFIRDAVRNPFLFLQSTIFLGVFILASFSHAATAPDSFEPDGNVTIAKLITVDAPSPQLHNILNANDVDFVKFSAAAGETYVIQASNVGADLWVSFDLGEDDGIGEFMSFDFTNACDYGESATLAFTAPYSGVFYVVVWTFGNVGPSSNYSLSVTIPQPAAPDSYEPDNSQPQATELMINGAIQNHTIHAPSDTDWLSFRANLFSAPYQIDINNLTMIFGDPLAGEIWLEVYDSTGTPVYGISLAPEMTDAIELNAQEHITQDGIYYIKVYTGEWVYTPDMSYEIQISSQNHGQQNIGTYSLSKTLALINSEITPAVSGTGFGTVTRASISLDTTNKQSTLSRIPTPGSWTVDVAVEKGIAYIPAQALGLLIEDVSDPTKPRNLSVVSGIDCGFPTAVKVRGNIAYTVGYGGLTIIDVSNPLSPNKISSVGTLANSQQLEIAGNYAYIAAGFNGVEIIDISIPASPNSIAVFNTDGMAQDVKVKGNYLYVADGSSGLEILDIATPLNPQHFDTIQGGADSLHMSGNILYVVNRYTNIAYYDISDLSFIAPENSGVIDIPAEHLIVNNNIAYVSAGESGLFIVDINVSGSSQIIGAVDTQNSAGRLAVVDGIAYVTDGEAGVQIVDVAHPSPYKFLGALAIPGNGGDLEMLGDYAYISEGGSFKVVDLTNPALPVLIGQTNALGGQGLIIHNDIAYSVLGMNGIQLVDISAPGSPQNIGTVAIPGFFTGDIAASGNYVYAAAQWGGIKIINVSNPLTPFVEASYEDLALTPGTIEQFGNYLYSCDYDGCQILDLTNPAAPSFVSQISIPDVVDIKVEGNYLYFAQYHTDNDPLGDELAIYDIQNPANPAKIGSFRPLDFPIVSFNPQVNRTRLVISSGTNAYLMDQYGIIHAIDISVKTKPALIGNIEVPTYGSSAGFAVHGANAVVSLLDIEKLLVTVPLPQEITQITVTDPENMTMTIPGQATPGHYNLRIFHGANRDILPGAVSFTDNPELLATKAIIVAGGGPGATGNIWGETKAYANLAYESLLYQGYTPEDIQYLTAQSDAMGRSGDATLASLQYAITDWAKNAPDISELLVYLVDHGGAKSFELSGGPSPEILTAQQLDVWLDDLQLTMPGKVIIVYDACESGSFISSMSAPANSRITLTSSSANQASYFLGPNHSFSYHFWSTLSGKSGDRASIGEAFARAAEKMNPYQTALVEVNGNGIPNEAEDIAALTTLSTSIYASRRGYNRSDMNKPVIAIVSGDQTLSGSTMATLSAQSVYDIDGDMITRVWAEITPPDFNPATNLTITNIVTVDLTDLDTDGVYQGSYANFSVQGSYIITYYAEDENGILSLPRNSIVIQSSGTVNSSPDSYENDDNSAEAGVIVVNNPTTQSHTFHDPVDEDWVKFYALADKTYKIKTSNLSMINDTQIALYDDVGTEPPIGSANAGGYGAEEYLVWTCPPEESGIYTVKISNAGPHYGANVRYELMVYEPTADFFTQGMIEGYVKKAAGAVPIINAQVRTTDNQAVALTQRNPDGYYLMMVEGGRPYTLEASAPGFDTATLSNVNVAIMASTTGKDFSLLPANSAPVIGGTPASRVDEDSYYTFTPTVDDPGDTFSFSITGQPGWGSFNTNTGQLYGTPNNSHVGPYTGITITVTDSKGATDSLPPFTITVNNTNDAPVITSGTPPSSVDQDFLYTYTATASDEDAGDSITFTISDLPGWAMFDSVTGILTGTPRNDDVSTYSNIIITATDQSNATTSIGPFSITVNNINDAPVADAGSNLIADEKTPVTLTGSASDPDVGDIPTLLWEQIGGSSVTLNNPTTATPSFDAPEVGPEGEVLTFQLTATDGYTASHSDNCTVTINWVAEATAGPDQIIDERDTTTLSAVADPDGTIFSVEWTQVSDPAAELTDWHTLTPAVTAPNVDEGASELLEFEVTINYVEGQSATDSCFITVNDLAEDLDHDNDIDGSDVAEFGSQLDQGSNTITIDQFSEEFGN